MTVLCSISTRGRYDTTLPLALMAVAMQTRVPDALIIYDDNDQPRDLREIERYRYIFQILDNKKIDWKVIFGQKKGQHHNHQQANKAGYDFVWRVDDDCVPEPNVLETLMGAMTDGVGCVGGSVLTPPVPAAIGNWGGMIDGLFLPNPQWAVIDRQTEVDHLHCSFLYRAGVVDYDLRLSRVAHREETLFSYSFVKEHGMTSLIVPCITWHLRAQEGGIRDGQRELFDHDEAIFQAKLAEWNLNVQHVKHIVLDSGLGDHIVFKQVFPEIREKFKKNKIYLYVCYPEVFEEEQREGVEILSIGQAMQNLGDITSHNVYKYMIDTNHKTGIAEAYRRLYGV